MKIFILYTCSTDLPTDGETDKHYQNNKPCLLSKERDWQNIFCQFESN